MDLASTMETSCHQVPPKADITTDAKNNHSLDGFRIDFLIDFDSRLAARGFRELIFGSFLSLGAILGLRWPRCFPKRASGNEFEMIFKISTDLEYNNCCFCLIFESIQERP